MKNNTTHIPKLDLFLDVNMPHLEDLTRQFGTDIGLRDKRQIKGLRLLLCNIYIQGQREVMVSRRKQSQFVRPLHPVVVVIR